MPSQNKEGAWFAARTYGHGSGLPMVWQGWVMLAVHIAVILAGLPLAAKNPTIYAIYAVVMALIPMPLYAAKTQGGWKWRWSEED